MTSETHKNGLNIPGLVVLAMLALAALCGIADMTILTLGVVLCFITLLLHDELYLAFPFVIFYNAIYGTALGFSIMRVFAFLVFVNVLLQAKNKSTVNIRTSILFAIYLFYVTLTMVPHVGISSSLFTMMDISCCLFIVLDIKKKPNALQNFFKVYALICVISYFSGILADNYIHNEYTFSRFNGTFEDPNYMGFFFTIAIFALVCLKLFDKRIRFGLVVVLYVMMLTTLSLSAILANIMTWVLYCMIMNKWQVKRVVIVVIAAVMVVSLYNYGLNNSDAPIIGDISERIEKSLHDFNSGNYEDATSGRVDHVKEHIIFWGSSSILNILFGGIPSNARYIYPELDGAAHNEYVDMLLNVGILGTIVMLGCFILGLAEYWKKYKTSKKDEYLFLVTGKVVWAIYAFTLTMFLDYRFLLIFLI